MVKSWFVGKSSWRYLYARSTLSELVDEGEQWQRVGVCDVRSIVCGNTGVPAIYSMGQQQLLLYRQVS